MNRTALDALEQDGKLGSRLDCKDRITLGRTNPSPGSWIRLKIAVGRLTDRSMASSFPHLQCNSVRCPICEQAVEVDVCAAAAESSCLSCSTTVWIRKADDDPQTISIIPVLSLSVEDGMTKTDVIRAGVRLLATLGKIPADREQQILAAVLEREDLGSTGIGNGFAIPHTSRGDVPHPVVAILRLSSGVDFGGLDAQPVTIMGLAICPAGRPDEYLDSLELISDYLHSLLSEDGDAL